MAPAKPLNNNELSMVEHVLSLIETNTKYTYSELSRKYNINKLRVRNILLKYTPYYKTRMTLYDVIKYLVDSDITVTILAVRTHVNVNNIKPDKPITKINIQRTLDDITGGSVIMASHGIGEYYEMSIAEISRELDIPIREVNRTLDSAMKKMHKHFKSKGIKYRYLSTYNDVDIRYI